VLLLILILIIHQLLVFDIGKKNVRQTV